MHTTVAEPLVDTLLQCCGCGENFMWTAAEQRFYHAKGFFKPKRCAACREAKRKLQERRRQRADRRN